MIQMVAPGSQIKKITLNLLLELRFLFYFMQELFPLLFIAFQKTFPKQQGTINKSGITKCKYRSLVNCEYYTIVLVTLLAWLLSSSIQIPQKYLTHKIIFYSYKKIAVITSLLINNHYFDEYITNICNLSTCFSSKKAQKSDL